MITLVPRTRHDGRAESPGRKQSSALLRSAIEPSGSSAYVEAVRDWIERVTPRQSARAPLRLVR